MNNSFTPGKIIIINGPSSSGKTTLALAAQKQFDIPFIRFSFDLFLDGHSLPIEQMRNGKFSWDEMRPSVFSGLHQCMAALAKTGNNLICDHIIESKDFLHDLLRAVSDLDVFFVGLHCSLPELERREIQRGNRGSGDAQRDLEFVHQFTSYDLELNSENPLDQNVKILIEAWQQRKHPSALDKMVYLMNLDERKRVSSMNQKQYYTPNAPFKFPEELLTPRKREILEWLDTNHIFLKALDKEDPNNMSKLRIYIPLYLSRKNNLKPGNLESSLSDPLLELFDYQFSLEYVDAYPGEDKFCLVPKET